MLRLMLALIILGAVLWFFNNAFHPASSGTAPSSSPNPGSVPGYSGPTL